MSDATRRRTNRYVRRLEGVDKVVGALLGTATVSADGAVHVEARSSYAVPCQNGRDGEVLVDVEFHKTMLGLSARAKPEERVVGWFSAGACAPEARALLHDFFAKDAMGGTPVHVELDAEFTSVESGGDLLRARVGETILATTDRESGESKSAGVRFSDIDCEVNMKEATLLGVDAFVSASSAKKENDVEGLKETMGKLSALLTTAQAYVDAVARGEREGDAAVGRALADALANVPQLTKAQLDKVLSQGAEDVMMVQYLTNLTKSQLVLAEKLHTAALLI